VHGGNTEFISLQPVSGLMQFLVSIAVWLTVFVTNIIPFLTVQHMKRLNKQMDRAV
jgi:hypothetical protein